MVLSDHIDDLEKNKFRGDNDNEVRVAVDVQGGALNSSSNAAFFEKFDLLLIELKKINKHLSEMNECEISDEDIK